MGIPYHTNDLGITFAVWGIAAGPYVIVPVLGPLLVLVVAVVVVLAVIVIWLVLVVKAFQGEMFQLPMLGDFAAQYANSI